MYTADTRYAKSSMDALLNRNRRLPHEFVVSRNLVPKRMSDNLHRVSAQISHQVALWRKWILVADYMHRRDCDPCFLSHRMVATQDSIACDWGAQKAIDLTSLDTLARGRRFCGRLWFGIGCRAASRNIGQLVQKVCQTSRSESSGLGHSTLIHELLDSKLPDSERSMARISQESGILLASGTVTTSWAVTTGVFWVLREPEVLRKLKEELAAALPPNLDSGDRSLLSVLEGLPYMAAVGQEMARLGHGILTRAARIAPDEDLAVPGTGFVIPKGTPTSMSHYFLNLDPEIFNQSHRFWPDRWIEQPELPQFSFSKGTRACLGRDLSLAEMYFLLAFMFRTFGTRGVRLEDDVGFLELFETDESDILVACDSAIVQPERDSKGVRCKVFHW